MSDDALIPSLLPRGPGHQFVVYGDARSGIPGAPHERTFAAVNAVLRRLTPPPEFILFLGDEIAGLTPNPDALRAQWRHWLEREMGWLDRAAIPLWHTTGNHTTYVTLSEVVFRETVGHLPRNGPPGQEGLSYWVRRGDLLMVFVHTLWTGLGGEGHVETEWLGQVLRDHSDARHKLVLGHHPIHPINGFSGAFQREVGPEHAVLFWDTLVEGGVLAYLCSHILAFDVQVHRGVLQICTAGAGTAHRMPEGIEYLHLVQACSRCRGATLSGARYRGAGAGTSVLAADTASGWRGGTRCRLVRARRRSRADSKIRWLLFTSPGGRLPRVLARRRLCCRRSNRDVRPRCGLVCAAWSND